MRRVEIVVDSGLGGEIGRRGIGLESPFLLWRRDRCGGGHGDSRWVRYGRISFNLVHRFIGMSPCSPRLVLPQLLIAAFFDAFQQFLVGCTGVTELHAFEKTFKMNQCLCRKDSLIMTLPSDILLLGVFLTTRHPLVDTEFTLTPLRGIHTLLSAGHSKGGYRSPATATFQTCQYSSSGVSFSSVFGTILGRPKHEYLSPEVSWARRSVLSIIRLRPITSI